MAKNIWDDFNPTKPGNVHVDQKTGLHTRAKTGEIVGSGPVAQPAPKKEEGGGGSGGSGGGGSFGSGLPSPFTENLNLPSQDDIREQYKEQLARGQALIEALGVESFRELISTALANKFTPPTEFQQLMSGQGTQSVGAPAGEFSQLEIGGPARTALQRGLTTLPPPGSGGQQNG